MKLKKKVKTRINNSLLNASYYVRQAMYAAIKADDYTVTYLTQQIDRDIDLLQRAILNRTDHASFSEEFILTENDSDSSCAACNCSEDTDDDDCENYFNRRQRLELNIDPIYPVDEVNKEDKE